MSIDDRLAAAAAAMAAMPAAQIGQRLAQLEAEHRRRVGLTAARYSAEIDSIDLDWAGDLGAAARWYRMAAANDFGDAALQLAMILDVLAQRITSGRAAGPDGAPAAGADARAGRPDSASQAGQFVGRRHMAMREELNLVTEAARWYAEAYGAGHMEAAGWLDSMIGRHDTRRQDISGRERPHGEQDHGEQRHEDQDQAECHRADVVAALRAVPAASAAHVPTGAEPSRPAAAGQAPHADAPQVRPVALATTTGPSGDPAAGSPDGRGPIAFRADSGDGTEPGHPPVLPPGPGAPACEHGGLDAVLRRGDQAAAEQHFRRCTSCQSEFVCLGGILAVPRRNAGGVVTRTSHGPDPDPRTGPVAAGDPDAAPARDHDTPGSQPADVCWYSG
jgi:hypothetical protein